MADAGAGRMRLARGGRHAGAPGWGSTLVCTPNSLDQEVGLALGAQAGPARIEAVVREAGFTRFRQAAATPFNLVFEARP